MSPDPVPDLRTDPPPRAGERATLAAFLTYHRETLRMKCDGLDADGEFDGAAADPALVGQAWAVWRDEVAFADRFVADAPDLDVTGDHHRIGAVSLRWVLVHMIEEYARHNGHADLLRQGIDGAAGE